MMKIWMKYVNIFKNKSFEVGLSVISFIRYIKVENDVSVFLDEDFFPKLWVPKVSLLVTYKDTEKSAVAHHIWITQHKVENEAKLLKQAEKPLELIIWEEKNPS